MTCRPGARLAAWTFLLLGLAACGGGSSAPPLPPPPPVRRVVWQEDAAILAARSDGTGFATVSEPALAESPAFLFDFSANGLAVTGGVNWAPVLRPSAVGDLLLVQRVDPVNRTLDLLGAALDGSAHRPLAISASTDEEALELVGDRVVYATGGYHGLRSVRLDGSGDALVADPGALLAAVGTRLIVSTPTGTLAVDPDGGHPVTLWSGAADLATSDGARVLLATYLRLGAPGETVSVNLDGSGLVSLGKGPTNCTYGVEGLQCIQAAMAGGRALFVEAEFVGQGQQFTLRSVRLDGTDPVVHHGPTAHGVYLRAVEAGVATFEDLDFATATQAVLACPIAPPGAEVPLFAGVGTNFYGLFGARVLALTHRSFLAGTFDLESVLVDGTGRAVLGTGLKETPRLPALVTPTHAVMNKLVGGAVEVLSARLDGTGQAQPSAGASAGDKVLQAVVAGRAVWRRAVGAGPGTLESAPLGGGATATLAGTTGDEQLLSTIDEQVLLTSTSADATPVVDLRVAPASGGSSVLLHRSDLDKYLVGIY